MKITRVLWIVLCLLPLVVNASAASNNDIVVYPTDDSFFQRLKTVPETGASVLLPVRRGTEEPLYNRYALFRFDLSGYTAEITGDVWFRLYYKEERSGSSPVFLDIQRQLVVAELPGWEWSETSLSSYTVSNPTTTHNNQFTAFITSLESARVDVASSKRSSKYTSTYWEWDLTEFIKSKKAQGNSVVTLLVYEHSTSGGQGSSDLFFLSKESEVNKPHLLITSVSGNANLVSLTYDADLTGNFKPVPDFNDVDMNYLVPLPIETVGVPVVQATPARQDAVLTLSQAQSLDDEPEDRTATIEVLAPDGVTTKTYHVVFEKQDDSNEDGTVEIELWKSATTRYKRNMKTVSGLPGYQSNPDAVNDFNWYGSNIKLRVDSTGYFYVKQIDDRWWLIDPDGYAGLNMAVTTINTASGVANWAYDLLKGIGFNGAGNFITPENLPVVQYNGKSFEPFSYTRRGLGDKGNVGPTTSGGFFQRYQSYRKTKGYSFPSHLTNGNYITIMDPEFEEFCELHAKNYFSPHANERNMMGAFSDNEINFNQDQLLNFLRDLPDTDPNYRAAMDFIATKGIALNTVLNSYASVSNAVKEEFAGVIAERYYSLVSASLKKYLPNHLYLGSRLHGRPRGIRQVIEAAARYCDVISVNFYDYPTPNEQISHPRTWGEWTGGKPCLITEFYAKGLQPSGVDLQDGAGYMVKSQRDRGIFYQNTCLEILESKYYIGWQYFRWIDDGLSNKGIVSVNHEPWTEMIEYMKELNTQAYNIIDYFDNRVSEPVSTHEVRINPVSDTYSNMGNPTTSYGADLELVIANPGVSSGEREAFLKFSLGAYADSLSSVTDAYLRLYDASGMQKTRSLKVFGVINNDWEEATLTASTLDQLLRSEFGKLRTHTSSISSSKNYIDLNVRNWLMNYARPLSETTFRIADATSDTEVSSWYSKESSHTPQLILQMKNSPVSGVNLPDHTAGVYVFQNHNREVVVGGITRPLQVSVYTVTGLLVWQGMLSNNVPEAMHLQPGVYIVSVDMKPVIINKKITIS